MSRQARLCVHSRASPNFPFVTIEGHPVLGRGRQRGREGSSVCSLDERASGGMLGALATRLMHRGRLVCRNVGHSAPLWRLSRRTLAGGGNAPAHPGASLQEFYRESSLEAISDARPAEEGTGELLSPGEEGGDQPLAAKRKPFTWQFQERKSAPPTELTVDAIRGAIDGECDAPVSMYISSRTRQRGLVECQMILQLDSKRERVMLAECLIKKVCAPPSRLGSILSRQQSAPQALSKTRRPV